MARIDAYFQYLIESGGSDLHLSEGAPPKVRIHGSITAIPDQPRLAGDDFKDLLAEICDAEAFQSYLKSGDLDFAYEMNEDSRFRCNYLQQKNGLAAVFRLIPTEIASLEDLNIPTVVKEFGHMRSGLVLVTGPTGSGKSTTLAALLDYINTNFARHIITVEEPIEFVHRNKRSIITQREVPIQTPTFADGLRAALREDADIVLVGEMRDLETISLALTAAETGLLVFGTVPKQVVATGAELTYYGGFSNTNYFYQPYNSNLNFGTGDLCIMFWAKFTQNNAYDDIMARRAHNGSAYTGNGWYVQMGNDQKYYNERFCRWNKRSY